MDIQTAASLLNLEQGTYSKKEIKKAYKAISLKYHPDKNPAGVEMMQAINDAWAVLKDIDPLTVTGENSADYGDVLNAALNAIVDLPDLEIEVCGSWVWVTGDTKTHKEVLKEVGFKWAKKKKAWYYRPAEYKSKNRGSWDMDKIRDNHGSNKVKATQRRAIAA